MNKHKTRKDSEIGDKAKISIVLARLRLLCCIFLWFSCLLGEKLSPVKGLVSDSCRGRMFHTITFLVFFYTVQFSELNKIQNKNDAQEYLERLGYAEQTIRNRFGGNVEDESRYREALWNYQLFYGLTPSGLLNNATMKMMNRARCGNPDAFTPLVGTPRRKRFALSSFKWRKQIVTYRVMDYPPNALAKFLPKEIVDSEIAYAFSMWSPTVNITFLQLDYSPVDIEIRFVEKSHGDSVDFEGPGLMLAHAYYPDPETPFKGDIHFDSEEPWTFGIPKADRFHFRWIAIHEIGHSLGLEHSQIESSYMFAMYPLDVYDPNTPLHIDDIEGAQILYDVKITDRSSSAKMMMAVEVEPNGADRSSSDNNEIVLRNSGDFTLGQKPFLVRNPFSEWRIMICKINDRISNTFSAFLKSLLICIPTEYFE